MRQSNILIICFVIFVLAFLGYSLWQSKATAPLSTVSKERQEADMKAAEKYLHDAEPERSLPIIHQYKEEMEINTPEGKKWLNLFADASADLNDSDQLLMIHQFTPEVLKNNEKGALSLANAFIKEGNLNEYAALRKLWKNREDNLAAWTLLDADALLQQGQKQSAYELLKDKKWTGKFEDERLMHIALIQMQEDPQKALDILNAEYSKDPKNSEILIFKGKIYESQRRISLAEQDFNTAAIREPRNIYLQDQLAEFYRRQKNYPKALAIWQKLLPLSPNDQIWVKSLFWSHVASPTTYDWKKAPLPEEKSRAFLVYFLGLKPGQYWNQSNFEKLPNNLDSLSDYQATYWLRLLQALKTDDEQGALSLLNNNHFEASSWAPMLEITLHRILNYRQNGSLLIEGDIPNSESMLNVLSGQNNVSTLYKDLDTLAQQEANQGSSFKLPDDMKALLNSQEIFAVALLSEGWTEAALQLHPVSLLSADFPDWVQALYVNALRQNRGNQAALQFAAGQKQTPTIILLKAEIEIAEGKTDRVVPELEKLKSDPSDIGARAAWLISLIDLEKGQYRKAGEAIEAHPKLSQTLQGQETLGRIAVLEGEPEIAAQIYQKIMHQSTEAKSFLVRQAYQQKNWALARELTEDLLNEFPGNVQLQENLKKIISQEKR